MVRVLETCTVWTSVLDILVIIVELPFQSFLCRDMILNTDTVSTNLPAAHSLWSGSSKTTVWTSVLDILVELPFHSFLCRDMILNTDTVSTNLPAAHSLWSGSSKTVPCGQVYLTFLSLLSNFNFNPSCAEI